MKGHPQDRIPAECKLYCASPGYSNPGWGLPAGIYTSISLAAEAALRRSPFDPGEWAADPGDPDRVFWPRRDAPSAAARIRWTIIAPNAAGHLADMAALNSGGAWKATLTLAWLHAWGGAVPLTRPLVRAAAANTFSMHGEIPPLDEDLEEIAGSLIALARILGIRMAPESSA